MLSLFYQAIFILFLQNGYVTYSATWLPGTYALLKPKTGCPIGWREEGSINHITGPKNNNSNALHIEGKVIQKRVSTHFCIKRISKTESLPTGQYCIYGKANWLYKDYVRMYEVINSWNNVQSFVSKYYNWYITLYFFCQTSGNKKIPISLPITKPFYLLPYGSRDCQQVKWMVATPEWIKYHTWNYEGYKYRQKSGTTPYHELGDIDDKGITMYYCYYESCNDTLNDIRGVFQSPGFPGKYPDGQLCSLRIMVPDNHTLVVNFTKFSLYEYDKDSLQLYENDSRIFKPKQAYFGHQQPFTITATSDVMFVFRSDEENNNNGFRAEYEIFKPPERTTTAKPPTTELIKTQPPTTIKRPITTEAATTINVNSTTNETVQCNPNPTKDKSYNKRYINPLRKKTCFCDETWRIVVMVIPLAVFILIVLVTIDIFCRCRYKKALKSAASVSSANDGMVINPTYERGNIILDQSIDTVTNETTVDDQPQSHDDPPDYEDVDYTELNEIPPPRRSIKPQECHALQPVSNDTSSVFYHVLEPPKTESDRPQSYVPEPVGNGAPEVFYNTLEPPTDFNRPTYQNLSEVSQYTLNPVYESAENSAPLFEANKLYDNYIA